MARSRTRPSEPRGQHRLRVRRRSETPSHCRHPLVAHEKERRRDDLQSASSPVISHEAGRGQRRGLDGSTLPRPSKKRGTRICPNRQPRSGGAAGVYLVRRQTGPSRASLRVRRAPGAIRRQRADEPLSNALGIRPSRPDSGARLASSQVHGRRGASAGSRPARSAPCPSTSEASPSAQLSRAASARRVMSSTLPVPLILRQRGAWASPVAAHCA